MAAVATALEIKTPEVFLPLLRPSRYKGLHGGRGGAKSWFFAELLIELCLEVLGLRAVCIREYQVSLEQSVKRLLEDVIARWRVTHKFRILDTHIETPGDGIIIFQGMQNHTADSIKSLEGYHIAWVEEAQRFSQRSLNLLRPTIRTGLLNRPETDGGEIWFSWNPRDPKDPVDEMLRRNPPPDAIVVKTSWRDNPFFPDVLRREMEYDRRRDVDTYNHVWEGGYEERGEARVFKNWQVRDFEEPDSGSYYYGADWGYSVDPSVLVRCRVDGRTLYVDREAYQIGCEIDHLGGLFSTVPGAKEAIITADSARPETISYLQRHGFPQMKPAVKGKDSVKEGVIFLQGYDIVVHSRCKHTIDELTGYSYKVDPKTEKVMQPPQLEDKKNHVIDSLRYAVESLRKPSLGAVW